MKALPSTPSATAQGLIGSPAPEPYRSDSMTDEDAALLGMPARHGSFRDRLIPAPHRVTFVPPVTSAATGTAPMA